MNEQGRDPRDHSLLGGGWPLVRYEAMHEVKLHLPPFWDELVLEPGAWFTTGGEHIADVAGIPGLREIASLTKDEYEAGGELPRRPRPRGSLLTRIGRALSTGGPSEVFR